MKKVIIKTTPSEGGNVEVVRKPKDVQVVWREYLRKNDIVEEEEKPFLKITKGGYQNV